ARTTEAPTCPRSRLPAVPGPEAGEEGPARGDSPALRACSVADAAVLEGPSQADARRDPRGPARMRRRRLPIEPGRAQLPADVRRERRAPGGRAGTRSLLRRPCGLCAPLPNIHRRLHDIAARRIARSQTPGA